MMISDWIKTFNLSVIPNETRPDIVAGDVVYRLADFFTTRGGSWEPSDAPGSIPPWAREKYLRPLGASDFFDEAGADHHLFARVLDAQGAPVVEPDVVIYWSDGLGRLADATYDAYIKKGLKPGSGWAAHPIFEAYAPQRGEQGAWCWCPRGAADVVVGGGLPNKQHVSFFAVWRAESHPSTAVEPNGNGNAIFDNSLLAAMREKAWHQAGLPFNPESAFARYARSRQLGAPITVEFELGSFRAQGFANGIVYALVGRWEETNHVDW